VFGTYQTTYAAEYDTIVDAAVDNDLTTLVELVTSAGLAGALSDTGADLTVFAPTNNAFNKIPRVLFRAIENDPSILVEILKYHVAPVNLMAEDVVMMDTIETLQGEDISVRTVGNNVFLNTNAKVIAPDVETGNGTVHVINRVLIPWKEILPDILRALGHR
jgi:uncharacterized surface protein with fasciclin (FAS1) repeats